MYLQHYQLAAKPFTLLPDPEFLYMGKRHATAYALLEYGMLNDSGGFIVISGEVGSGKTTLLRKILTENYTTATIGLLNHTHSDYGELLQWVLMSFNLKFKNKNKVELYYDFINFIKTQHQKGKPVVLILDEAHNLSLETLEEIRMLANINTEAGKIFKLIISGQPELLHKLRQPELSQFAQRVTIQYHLEALNKQECFEYIKHRLTVAGAQNEIFDESAILMVWYYSRGTPRVINTLCDLSLVYGFAEKTTVISAEIVRQVMHDRKIGGLFTADDDATDITVSPVNEGMLW